MKHAFVYITLKLKPLFIYLWMGWALAPIIQFINKYVFSDWEFLKFLFVICSVDTILGFLKAMKYREVSSKGFAMVFKKIMVYTSVLIVTHVLMNFTINNKGLILFGWFDSVIFSAIVVREAISIFENIASIDPTLIPASILKYLKQFNADKAKKDINNN